MSALRRPTAYLHPGLKAGLLSLLGAGLLSLWLAGCAAAPFPLARALHAPDPGEGRDQLLAEQEFIIARECEFRGLADLALRHYSQAYALDPHSATLRKVLAEYYFRAGEYDKAERLLLENKAEGPFRDDQKRMLAGLYLRQRRLDEAVGVIAGIKDKEPGEYYTLEMYYESQGRLSEAAEYCAGFLAKNPEAPEAWLREATLCTALKRFGAADSLLDTMELRFGKMPQIANGRGVVRLFRKDTAAALASFKEAVLEDSTFTEALRSIARILASKAQWEQALPYYEKLQKSASPSAADGKALAMLYYSAGKFDKARALLQRLLSDSVGDPDLHFYCGLVLAAQENTDASRMEFEKALVIKTDFPDAWEQLCRLAVKEKDCAGAESAAQRFSAAMPYFAGAWSMEGYVLNTCKEYGRALPMLKKSLSMDSTDPEAWFEMGASLERLKETAKAAVAFRRVLALRPADPEAANYLGYMWAEEGIRLDSARCLLRGALSRDSLNGAYLDSYAWICYKAGDLDSADAYIVKAIAKIGDDPIVYSHYGAILLKKGDGPAALTAYRKALDFVRPDNATEEEINAIKEKIDALEKTPAAPGGPHAPSPKDAPGP